MMKPSKFVADRVADIGASGIRRVFDLGASLKNPVNLSIGQPDYPVPESVKRAMVDAILSDHNGYTVTRGIAPLRERIARELKAKHNWEPDIFVISGLSGGLFLSMLACINPGDEVIFTDPYFVSYPFLVRLAGGTPVPVSIYDDFQLHPERIEAAITPRTKMLLLASPGNPTGIVYSRADMKAVTAIAEKHDLLMVSDEIYQSLCYDGEPAGPVEFAPERTIMLRGFGKSHALTGLRIGYAAGPTEIISEMAKLQQYTFVCAPQPAQFGALAAFDADMSYRRREYREKRDLVCVALEGHFEFVRPSGGFYVFPKAPARFASASAFVDEAIRRNVLIINGSSFSTRDTHFRISYAAPNDRLREGCDILKSLAAGK